MSRFSRVLCMDKSASEDGDSSFLWNVGIFIFLHKVGTHLPDYMVWIFATLKASNLSQKCVFFLTIAGLQSSGDPRANGHCGEDPNTTSTTGAGAATTICCCKSSFLWYKDSLENNTSIIIETCTTFITSESINGPLSLPAWSTVKSFKNLGPHLYVHSSLLLLFASSLSALINRSLHPPVISV